MNQEPSDPIVIRPRRLRKSASVRRLVREVRLSAADLIMPIFIKSADGPEPISALPGLSRLGIQDALRLCERLLSVGVSAVAPFPVIAEEHKDDLASYATDPTHHYLTCVAQLKRHFPEMSIITDVAMDPYSSAGHDGFVDQHGQIDNDRTLPILQNMAVAQAQSGTDFVAPSDMMDGRVAAIRRALDAAGYTGVGIISYSSKYASNFYGPFREALGSAPKKGDKKTYQMDYANSCEALREAHLDIAEGADMLMVKPGLAYLDIVSRLHAISSIPIAVYNVSGEYAMLNACAQGEHYQQMVEEVLSAFKRAGANCIFTYHALEFAEWMRSRL